MASPQILRTDRTLGRPVQRFDWIEWKLDQIRRVDLPNGMVDVPGVATKVGVLLYPQPDGSVVRELRPRSEVMDPASLGTLVGQYMTDEHPGQGQDDPEGRLDVTPENVRSLFHGSVLQVEPDTPDQGLVGVVLRLASEEILAAAQGGKHELSAGYTTVLLDPADPAAAQIVQDAGPEPGVTHEGERYDLIQTQIRYNHLALVQEARAGPVARLRMDSMKKTKVKIDGKTHQVPQWLVDAAKAVPQDRADQGEVLEVAIEGMEKPLVLPKEMVAQMLAAIGMPTPGQEPTADLADEPTQDLLPNPDDPEDEQQRRIGDDMDKPEDQRGDTGEAVARAVSRELQRQLPQVLRGILPKTVRQITDSVTSASRDRAEVDRRATAILGDSFDFSSHDHHGVALEVLKRAESPRVSQGEALVARARKGDSFAAGQLRTLMDITLDRHRDQQDGSGDLAFQVIDLVVPKGEPRVDTRPSWEVAQAGQLATAQRRTAAEPTN